MLQEDEGGGDQSMKKRRQEKMDRISDLPEPIVHHIMSNLSNLEITKISILSKRFLLLWSSFPVMDFDESTFDRSSQGTSASRTDEFLDHIYNSIRLRKIDTVISEFRVKANLKGISSDDRLDSAILFAVGNGVKSLDLNLGFTKYQFPDSFASRLINVLTLTGLQLNLCSVIQACPSLKTVSLTSCEILQDIKFSSQTLTEIELHHCCAVKFIKITAPKLHSFFFTSDTSDPQPCTIDLLQCQNIANLSLYNVVSGRDWVEEHVSKLSKLETFILGKCQDIESLSIWNEKLERVEINDCSVLSSIRVIATSLKSFRYRGTNGNRISKISFIASRSIKDLYIENAAITDEWLEAELSTLCRLESLRLKGCNTLKKIVVIHEKLQIFELLNCLNLDEAEIDTPQLVSFVYHGKMMALAQMVTRSICNATLHINPAINNNESSVYGWRKFLSFFGHCKVLKLICNNQKELIIPEDFRENLVPPLYDLQCLEVHIKSLEKIERDLVDSLLWLSPLPTTLRIFSASGTSQLQMIIKFEYDETIKEEEDKNPFCCTMKPVKCWKHKLTTLDIQTTDVSPKNESVEWKKYFRSNAKMLDSLSFKMGLG